MQDYSQEVRITFEKIEEGVVRKKIQDRIPIDSVTDVRIGECIGVGLLAIDDEFSSRCNLINVLCHLFEKLGGAENCVTKSLIDEIEEYLKPRKFNDSLE